MKRIKEIAAILRKRGDLNEEHLQILQKKLKKELWIEQGILIVVTLLFISALQDKSLLKVALFAACGITLVTIAWKFTNKKFMTLCNLYTFGIVIEGTVEDILEGFYLSGSFFGLVKKRTLRYRTNYQYRINKNYKYSGVVSRILKQEMPNPIPKIGDKVIVIYQKENPNIGQDTIIDSDNNGKIMLEGIELSATAKSAIDENNNILENTWIIEHNNKQYYLTRVNQYSASDNSNSIL